ncbi:hypothetical protein [Terribacillus saccharophilus]|uniref:hypothetical protein n=1 Tax=Terribacillus saccharophilus TaxID=361277 RepID=UPI003D2C74F2
MINSRIKAVLLLVALSVTTLCFLYIDAKEQQINAENKVNKLEQRVDKLYQENVYLVDEVFNLNSQLEKN